MKVSCLILLFFCFVNYSFESKNKNKKGMSKFERHYSNCKDNLCRDRKNDDNCIYKCIDNLCYEEILGSSDVYLEYGESDMKVRKLFENCYYKISK